MTKRQKQIIDNYNKATATSVEQVYNTCSFYKTRAEQMILQEMASNNGWGYKILGFNTCTFSCAYLMTNKEDGQIQIVYHTAQNKMIFDY